MSTGPPAQDYFVRTSKFFSFYLDIYIYILHFTFLFPLFVFVSTAGHYNVIWTGTGLHRFLFCSGTVPALLF